MQELMEVFTTLYLQWLFIAPLVICLLSLCYILLSNVTSFQSGDVVLYFIIIVFIAIAFVPINEIFNRSSFFDKKAKQYDGIEEYEEALERTGEAY